MRRPSRALPRLTALALLAGSALACGGGDEAAGPPPPEVVVATARRGSVPDRREYVGNVRAAAEVEVRARVRGYLLAQHFEDGQHVDAGQLLFEIDPVPFQVALAEAKGRLASASAEARRAEHDFTRAEDLFARKVVSVAILDQRRAERDAALAGEESAQAEVRSAELDLSYCSVTAPIAGRIGRRLVDIGNLVGASGRDTVLARIVQIDPVHVYFAPTELDRLDVLRGAREGRIPQERVGHIPIELRLGDDTPYPYPGMLDFVDPTIDPTRGTVTVRARVPNPEGDLKPGEFVRVTAIFPDVTDAVLVPERAVQQEQGGSYVLVVGADSVVQNRPVVLGVAHDGQQQIASGVAEGERVIVDGVQKARPGSSVAAREEGGASSVADGPPPAS
jgi:membrane fusion protein (multidrug efflux system)